MNEKKGTKGPKKFHVTFLCPSLATSLLGPHLGPWASHFLSVVLHLWDRGLGMGNLCGPEGTVSADGAERGQKATVTPQRPPTFSNTPRDRL